MTSFSDSGSTLSGDNRRISSFLAGSRRTGIQVTPRSQFRSKTRRTAPVGSVYVPISKNIGDPPAGALLRPRGRLIRLRAGYDRAGFESCEVRGRRVQREEI